MLTGEPIAYVLGTMEAKTAKLKTKRTATAVVANDLLATFRSTLRDWKATEFLSDEQESWKEQSDHASGRQEYCPRAYPLIRVRIPHRELASNCGKYLF